MVPTVFSHYDRSVGDYSALFKAGMLLTLQELMEAKDLISNLESSVSKLKLELAESNRAQGAIHQQVSHFTALCGFLALLVAFML